MFKRQKSKHSLDIDIRFLLANERTLLAWVRTGLTLIAGGVAVAFIASDGGSLSTIAGLGAIGFGGVLAIVGYLRYRAADAAIRAGELPATGFSSILVVAGVIAFAVALVLIRDLKVL